MALSPLHRRHPHIKTHSTPPHVRVFIDKLLPIARGVKTKYNVPVAVLIAQGALESAWGQHVKGNAFFGIKGHSPSGASVTFNTHEVEAGKSLAITDRFRAYANLEDAADDYGRFLASNPRYRTCFAFSDNPEKFVDSLAAAKYATDPNYATKLKSIIKHHSLAAYDITAINK